MSKELDLSLDDRKKEIIGSIVIISILVSGVTLYSSDFQQIMNRNPNASYVVVDNWRYSSDLHKIHILTHDGEGGYSRFRIDNTKWNKFYHNRPKELEWTFEVQYYKTYGTDEWVKLTPKRTLVNVSVNRYEDSAKIVKKVPMYAYDYASGTGGTLYEIYELPYDNPSSVKMSLFFEANEEGPNRRDNKHRVIMRTQKYKNVTSFEDKLKFGENLYLDFKIPDQQTSAPISQRIAKEDEYQIEFKDQVGNVYVDPILRVGETTDAGSPVMYINKSNTDRDIEHGSTVNLTAQNSGYDVCISHSYYGNNYTCDTDSITDIIKAKSYLWYFNDSTESKNFTSDSTTYMEFDDYTGHEYAYINLTGYYRYNYLTVNYPTNVNIKINNETAVNIPGTLRGSGENTTYNEMSSNDYSYNIFPEYYDKTKNYSLFDKQSKTSYIAMNKISNVTSALLNITGYSSQDELNYIDNFSNNNNISFSNATHSTFNDDIGDKLLPARDDYTPNAAVVKDSFDDGIYPDYVPFGIEGPIGYTFTYNAGSVTESGGVITLDAYSNSDDGASIKINNITGVDYISFDFRFTNMVDTNYVQPILGPHYDAIMGVADGNVYLLDYRDGEEKYWDGSSWTTSAAYCHSSTLGTWHNLEVYKESSDRLSVEGPGNCDVSGSDGIAIDEDWPIYIANDEDSDTQNTAEIDNLLINYRNFEKSATTTKSTVVDTGTMVAATLNWFGELSNGSVTGYLSINNGTDWKEITKGTEYNFNDSFGNKLKYKLVIDGDASGFPQVDKVFVNQSANQYPSDLYIDTGGSGAPTEWNHTKELNESNSPVRINLGKSEINNYLESCNPDEDGYCYVPFKVYTETPGKIKLSDLAVDAIANWNPVNITGFDIPQSDYSTAKIDIYADNWGKLGVSDINISYYGKQDYKVTANSSGSTNSINYTTYYSNFNITKAYPYLSFYPDSYTDYNVTPYGQKEDQPFWSVDQKTWEHNANFGFQLNESLDTCQTMYINNRSNRSSAFELNTSTIELMESRKVKIGNTNKSEATISFSNTYTNPVVFATVNSFKYGGNSSLAKINVDSNSFTVSFCQHENEDGKCDPQTPEEIGYFASELDQLDSLDGIEAGKITLDENHDSSSEAKKINLENNYSVTTVIATQQTQNEAGEAVAQIPSTGTSSFKIYQCDHDESNVEECETHGNETFAWMAFNPSYNFTELVDSFEGSYPGEWTGNTGSFEKSTDYSTDGSYSLKSTYTWYGREIQHIFSLPPTKISVDFRTNNTAKTESNPLTIKDADGHIMNYITARCNQCLGRNDPRDSGFYARDGNNEVLLTKSMDNNTWYNFSAEINYVKDTWAVYLDGNLLKSGMEVNSGPLPYSFLVYKKTIYGDVVAEYWDNITFSSSMGEDLPHWMDPGKAYSIENSGWKNQNFSKNMSANGTTPIVLTTINSNNEGQEAKPARVKDVSSFNASVGYCEHDTNDTCDDHNEENVGWLAINQNLSGYTTGYPSRYWLWMDFDNCPSGVYEQPNPIIKSQCESCIGWGSKLW